MDANSGGLEAQNGALEGLLTSGRRFPMSSRIRNRIEVKIWIQIRIKVKSRILILVRIEVMRIRNPDAE